MTYELQVAVREQTGKGAARQLRMSGKIPGVCYGTAVAPFGVSIDPVQLDRLLRTSPQGRNTVIDLDAGDGNIHHVLVQEIQRDPVRRSTVHVDFRVVQSDDRVVVSVPVHRTGHAEAEDMGGRLEQIRRRVDVICMVKDIPEAVVQDVSDLELNDRVRASELVPPEGCKLFYKIDFVVMSLITPRGIDEDEEVEELDEEETEEAAVEEEADSGPRKFPDRFGAR